MPPRRKLSDLDRGRAKGWLQDGVAARQVAQRRVVAPSVIIRLKQIFHATGRVQERQRSGRPRVTTEREDRFIQRQAMQQRMATASNIRQRQQATTNTVVSDQTIRNRLHNFGLRARRPVRGTTLTANHRAARRAWCTQHVWWQRQQWCCLQMSSAFAWNLLMVASECGGVAESASQKALFWNDSVLAEAL
ncbi:hypothetical protein V1264_012927 [Littorina saxatilis]|uniref:Transposase Tc1-like domain-containing protein n=1 Tax=Littorina saxatilis TaxID=31220 RepID=A0AAN9C3D4_9CAEN